MDDSSLTPMTPLDSMVSDDTLQMMKAALPYLPPRQARMLAVLAKFQELKNTLSMQPSRSDAIQAMSTSAPLDDDALLKALKTYGGERGKQMVNNVQQMKDMFLLISMMQSNSFSDKEDPEGSRVGATPRD